MRSWCDIDVGHLCWHHLQLQCAHGPLHHSTLSIWAMATDRHLLVGRGMPQPQTACRRSFPERQGQVSNIGFMCLCDVQSNIQESSNRLKPKHLNTCLLSVTAKTDAGLLISCKLKKMHTSINQSYLPHDPHEMAVPQNHDRPCHTQHESQPGAQHPESPRQALHAETAATAALLAAVSHHL